MREIVKTKKDYGISALRSEQKRLLQERWSLKSRLDGDSPLVQEVQEQLKSVTAKVKKAKLEYEEEKQSILASELHTAWRQKNLAEVARITRQLAANCVGAGRRWNNIPPSYAPTREEIVANLGRAGGECGMLAIEVSLSDLQDANLVTSPVMTPATIEQAESDIIGIKWALFSQKLRTSCLPRGLPVAILRVLFSPNWVWRPKGKEPSKTDAPIRFQSGGLLHPQERPSDYLHGRLHGHCQAELQSEQWQGRAPKIPFISRWLLRLQTLFRSLSAIPIAHLRSAAFFIPKDVETSN